METPAENRKIEIGQEILNNLNTTRKWAMFLAIIGFIFLGLVIIIGALAGTFLSAFNTGETGSVIPESLIFLIFIILAIAYFMPLLFLFRFSKHTATAIHTLNKLDLQKAFKNLKFYFAYIGLLIIIVLTFYVFILIMAGTSMSFLKGL